MALASSQIKAHAVIGTANRVALKGAGMKRKVFVRAQIADEKQLALLLDQQQRMLANTMFHHVAIIQA